MLAKKIGGFPVFGRQGHTSEHPEDEIFRGPSAFSEKETQNIRDGLLNAFPIQYVMDIHTAGQKISYPWFIERIGSDPSQWFGNTGLDNHGGAGEGRDGTTGDVYNEFFPTDLSGRHKTAAAHIQSRIQEATGADYTPGPGLRGEDPHTGELIDYAFSRQFSPGSTPADGAKRGPATYAILMEVGKLTGSTGAERAVAFQCGIPGH